MKLRLSSNIVLSGAIAALISACSPSGPSSQEQATDNCHYSYVDGTIKVIWTAYKTTERVGVSGSFDTVLVEGTAQEGTLTEVLANASFNIPTSSVNSANPDRDGKIVKHFFSSMVGGSELSGKVLAASDSELNVLLTMNGVTDTVPFALSASDSLLSLVGTIELADYQALASADSLNKVCFDLHKGADGVSKLWPDVKLEISAQLKQVCD